MYTKAVLCWGFKIDEELVDEEVVGDYSLSECSVIHESDFGFATMGCSYSGDIIPLLVADYRGSESVSAIDPLEKPSVEEVAGMISILKKLYGGVEFEKAPELKLYLGIYRY